MIYGYARVSTKTQEKDGSCPVSSASDRAISLKVRTVRTVFADGLGKPALPVTLSNTSASLLKS